MDRYFTIAPALIQIANEFHEMFEGEERTGNIHHELIGGKSVRMVRNVGILVNLLNELQIGTESTDDPLYNVFTKEVVPQTIASDIINRDALGEVLVTEFISERLTNGQKSVWDPMKKSTVATFLSSAIPIGPSKAKTKLKNTQDDCNWFPRFTIASRSRPDLDLADSVSRFEFGAVPRSLFAPDGNLLFETNKSSIVRHLESQTKSVPVNAMVTSNNDVLIIDGVAFLHKLKKGKGVVNCKDLSILFVNVLHRNGSGFFEVHLVMDRYLDKSLKNQTRSKRVTKQARQFIITPSTNIQNVSIKDLLSNTKTKRELIAFLCEQAVANIHLKRFCVTYENVTVGNFDFDERLKTHSQEEADTLMILHASTLDERSKVVIDSPDTDVAVLLIHHKPFLPDCLVFRTGLFLFTQIWVQFLYKLNNFLPIAFRCWKVCKRYRREPILRFPWK